DGVDITQIDPLMRGGTGSKSELEEQPEDLPDKFESGTGNLAGIAGLGAGLEFIADRGIDEIRAHTKMLSQALLDGLSSIPGVKVHGTRDPDRSLAVISFTVAGKSVSDVGYRLDEEFGVLARVGLHCAPAAHRTIGTFPEGAVRLAPGVFTTAEDIGKTIRAIGEVVK
ncbi:MAG: aminotransferase class V-fold PLP-dependent enzyme, partial [Candidatus Coatesbacteria bacterium]|nr:aminotransferase class V-fold PLP-dependent enzyme [Candidatus Coatesbacteria bacterium]